MEVEAADVAEEAVVIDMAMALVDMTMVMDSATEEESDGEECTAMNCSS